MAVDAFTSIIAAVLSFAVVTAFVVVEAPIATSVAVAWLAAAECSTLVLSRFVFVVVASVLVVIS